MTAYTYKQVFNQVRDEAYTWIEKNVTTAEQAANYDSIWETIVRDDIVLGSTIRPKMTVRDLNNTAVHTLFGGELLNDWWEDRFENDGEESFFDFLRGGAENIDWSNRWGILAKDMPLTSMVEEVTGFPCEDF